LKTSEIVVGEADFRSVSFIDIEIDQLDLVENSCVIIFSLYGIALSCVMIHMLSASCNDLSHVSGFTRWL